MSVKLFTNGSMKSKLLQSELIKKRVAYSTTTNIRELAIVKIKTVPVIKCNGRFYEYAAALSAVKAGKIR